MRLVYGNVARRAVHFTRRSAHDAGYATLPGCFEHIQRAVDIRVDVTRGRDVGVRDSDQRSEVEHDVAIPHRSHHEASVPNVTCKQRELPGWMLWNVGEVTGRIARVVSHHRA